MLTVQSPAHVNQSCSAEQYDVDTGGWCVRIGAGGFVGGYTGTRLAPTARSIHTSSARSLCFRVWRSLLLACYCLVGNRSPNHFESEPSREMGFWNRPTSQVALLGGFRELRPELAFVKESGFLLTEHSI